MGWFKRSVDAVNTHYDFVDDIAVALNPANRRVRKLDERGTPANGVITGIKFSLNDSTTRKEYAITALRPGGELVRIGVRTQPTTAHRLRLGVPVVVKLDGDRGILDWDAMAAAWQLTGQFLSQESIRSVPDDGIVDKALDSRVQKHLANWEPVQATVVRFERRTVMGMQSLNWNIDLRLPDGTTTTSKGDEVPSYAQWYVAPGLAVPAVVDPKDRSRASIDWPAMALANAGAASFDDDPPAGSIAAAVEQQSAAPAREVSTSHPAPSDTSSAEPDATMRSWIEARRSGALSAKDFEQVLLDWAAAGMCTEAQVAAARAAATQ